MEDDLKKKEEDVKKKGRRPQKIKWKTNQSTKIYLIGCDTIVNSPSLIYIIQEFKNFRKYTIGTIFETIFPWIFIVTD